jgi:glycosyltransferase involved in cell wall biosynthesis
VGPNWRGGQDRLEALARTLGIGGSVSFAGPTYGTDKWSLLTAADVFVHPSRWEAGIPFAVLEALLAGRPVLLTRAADPDGLVERYGAGFVSVARPDSIAKGLIEATRLDPAGLQQLSSAARRLVAREFQWEKTSKELLNEYRAVAVR